MSKNAVLGFLGASSPQSTANTQRVWYFFKTQIIKNTSKFRANTFGIYSPNGNSILTFRDHSKKEDICAVLEEFIKRLSNEGFLAGQKTLPKFRRLSKFRERWVSIF